MDWLGVYGQKEWLDWLVAKWYARLGIWPNEIDKLVCGQMEQNGYVANWNGQNGMWPNGMDGTGMWPNRMDGTGMWPNKTMSMWPNRMDETYSNQNY